MKDRNDLIVYGYEAHWMYLLVTPVSITKHVVEVPTYFKSNHRPAAWLRELSDKTPVAKGKME